VVTFEDIVAAGTALAHSIGHMTGCPKISPAIPCTCGCGSEQAKALDDWQHLTRASKEAQQTAGTSEAACDWSKAQRGEISFKTFADKWLPYAKPVDTKLGL
jgi:hypothetical protein